MAANEERFEELVDAFVAQKRPLAGINGQLAAIQRFNVSDQICNLDAPIMVIHGAVDAVVPVKNMRLYRKLLGGRVRLVTLREAGHLFWPMDDGRSRWALEAFMSGVDTQISDP